MASCKKSPKQRLGSLKKANIGSRVRELYSDNEISERLVGKFV